MFGGFFQFSILPGKLVSITVFALFSHDYFFCVWTTTQAWRGVTRRCADFKGDMCEDLGQPSSSLTHAHKSKCLLPLNVSLWPLECLSHRKLYILCFLKFSGGEHCLSCCGYFLQAVFQMAQTHFFPPCSSSERNLQRQHFANNTSSSETLSLTYF